MHEGEVTEVGEVLHLARGVGAPGEGPRSHHAPGGIFQLGHVGDGPAGLVQCDPDDAVPLDALVRPGPSARRDLRWAWELRDGRARAISTISPAVVGTDDLVA